ncbi:L-lactate dehydrogenase [Streptosporangium jomthongense]|uniref:L-lactate dehydrogenase n=1 Tax=Marinobacter aromaticivorans TaxID=1494078 RepID=A0ABW2ISS4_9GAMM|nr:L-lactate dehydrogenase [Marinobacter aromaticivorans]GGE59322.1 L-lactate dehydrogenase [Streptosporangium jomthongense]
MITPANTTDNRKIAKARLPRMMFDYFDGGAFSEQTLRENTGDFQGLHFRQRVMRDVSTASAATRILGQEAALPLALAPVGLAGMLARRGEVQAARAAQARGVPFCLSTVSICSLEEVAAANSSNKWFQLYVLKDRGYSEALLDRAHKAGYSTLVFTVDLPRVGVRYRDVRNGMNGGLSPWGKIQKLSDLLSHPLWLWDVVVKGKPLTFGNLSDAVPSGRNPEDFKAWVDRQFDASVTWKDLDWVRQHWQGKLVIKGIMDPDDALCAVDVGADGIVVSNHGGRQLDGAPSTISALPAIVKAVSGKTEILFDGGVQSGQDVVRALCLGANSCLVGRAWAYALAAGGEAAVSRLLDNFRYEVELTLALLGKNSVQQLAPDDLV